MRRRRVIEKIIVMNSRRLALARLMAVPDMNLCIEASSTQCQNFVALCCIKALIGVRELDPLLMLPKVIRAETSEQILHPFKVKISSTLRELVGKDCYVTFNRTACELGMSKGSRHQI